MQDDRIPLSWITGLPDILGEEERSGEAIPDRSRTFYRSFIWRPMQAIAFLNCWTVGRSSLLLYTDWQPGVKSRRRSSAHFPIPEVIMTAEPKESYRGVICIHCHQPTPLPLDADHKHKKFDQQDSDEFLIFSNPLRCRACHGEAVYSPKDVREFDGQPRKRASRCHAAA